MKNLFILLFFLVSIESYPQSGWFSQSSGVGNDLWSVCIVDSLNYWAVGSTPGNGAIIRTTNGGLNWIQQTSPVTNGLYAVKFVNVNTGWISGGGGVILKTTNGGSLWASQSSGTPNELWALYFIDVNTGYAGTNATGQIFKTTNSGTNWVLQSTISGMTHSNFYFINSNTGWVTTGNYPTSGNVYKTTNGGSNWIALPTGSIPTTEDVFFLNENTGWVCGQNGMIIKTTNGGSNWVNQSSGTSLNIFELYFINQNTGWAVAGDAGSPSNGKIIKTTNGGVNWFTQLTTTALYSLTFYNENIGSAVGKNGVIYKTITGGETIPPAPILLSPSNGSTNVSLTPTLFWNTVPIATYYKVQVSSLSNFGIIIDSATVTTNQRTIPSGKLNLASTYFWRVNASNQYGTSVWSDVWNFSTVITGIYKIGMEIPAKFHLYNNYPNPFNPVTKIKFDLPKLSKISLKIFDITGKEIESLVNQRIEQGEYEVKWDGSNYPSGIYFCKVIAGEYCKTIRMVLTK